MAHDKLKDLIYIQKKTVSIRDVCYNLGVHVSEARKILEEFIAEESKNDSELIITYVITGSGKNSSDDYKIHKIVHAKAEELEKAKEDFESITSCKINSVSVRKDEADESEVVVKAPLMDRDEILGQQRLTYIINDDIQVRTDRLDRLKLISGATVNDQNITVKTEDNSDESKNQSNKDTLGKNKSAKEIKSSNKRTQNRKNTSNKKQAKLTGFGSRASKSEKSNSSGDSGFSIESTPDPFTDEEEDEKSPERELENKFEDMDVDSQSTPPHTEVKQESDEDKPNPKKSESEDEAIVVDELKKVKKASKKRKRIRVYDSDEEDEETMALKILGGDNGEDETNSNHSDIQSSVDNKKQVEEENPSKKSKKKSKPSQPMETKTVSEEYLDEDGYTQVRLVKKLLPVEKAEEDGIKKEESIDNSDSDKNNKSKRIKTEKPALKKQKTEEEDEDGSKPKAKKLTKAAQAKKGQVSITSFFKPAAKV